MAPISVLPARPIRNSFIIRPLDRSQQLASLIRPTISCPAASSRSKPLRISVLGQTSAQGQISALEQISVLEQTLPPLERNLIRSTSTIRRPEPSRRLRNSTQPPDPLLSRTIHRLEHSPRPISSAPVSIRAPASSTHRRRPRSPPARNLAHRISTGSPANSLKILRSATILSVDMAKRRKTRPTTAPPPTAKETGSGPPRPNNNSDFIIIFTHLFSNKLNNSLNFVKRAQGARQLTIFDYFTSLTREKGVGKCTGACHLAAVPSTTSTFFPARNVISHAVL
jgi:hypothetical protein